MIEIEIPLVPLPKQSMRVARKDGKVITYQPKRLTSNARALIAYMLKKAPPAPWTGPASVDIEVFYRNPKGPNQERPLPWKNTRPDVDQLAKQVLDCLQAAGHFKEDAQVVELSVRKYWSPREETRIVVELLDP